MAFLTSLWAAVGNGYFSEVAREISREFRQEFGPRWRDYKDGLTADLRGLGPYSPTSRKDRSVIVYAAPADNGNNGANPTSVLLELAHRALLPKITEGPHGTTIHVHHVRGSRPWVYEAPDVQPSVKLSESPPIDWDEPLVALLESGMKSSESGAGGHL